MKLLELIDTVWIATTPKKIHFKRVWLFKTMQEASRAASQAAVYFNTGGYFPVEKAGSSWLVFETNTPTSPHVWALSVTESSAQKAGEKVAAANGVPLNQVITKQVQLSPWKEEYWDETD